MFIAVIPAEGVLSHDAFRRKYKYTLLGEKLILIILILVIVALYVADMYFGLGLGLTGADYGKIVVTNETAKP